MNSQLAVSVVASVRALAEDGKGPIMVAIMSGWFMSFGVRMIYPVLLPHIRITFALDLTTGGLLLTVLWLAYATGQIPGGILADRLGEGRILFGSILIAAVAITLVATAVSALVLFVTTALFGFVMAFYGVTQFTAIAELYPDNLGSAIGWNTAAADIGQSLLPPIAGIIAATVAWQLGFGVTVPLFLIVGIGLWKYVPGRTSGATSAVDRIDADSIHYILGELHQSSILFATIVLTLGSSVLLAFTGFYPTYLIEVKGLSASQAGILFGGFFALGIGIRPLSGLSFDHLGVRRSLFVFMGGAALGLLVLPVVENGWVIALITGIISLQLGYAIIITSYLAKVFEEDMRGTGLGIIRSTYFMIGALSPVVFGMGADRGYFDEGFFVLGILAITIVVIGSRMPEI